MQDESNQQPEIDPRLERALSHPKRREVLDYLMEKKDETGVATRTRELADALGLTAPTVKYHLTVLNDANLIAYVKKDRGQGKTERYIAASAGL